MSVRRSDEPEVSAPNLVGLDPITSLRSGRYRPLRGIEVVDEALIACTLASLVVAITAILM